jgi:hypothetical protein
MAQLYDIHRQPVGHKLFGILDLVLRNTNGEILVVDVKTAAKSSRSLQQIRIPRWPVIVRCWPPKSTYFLWPLYGAALTFSANSKDQSWNRSTPHVAQRTENVSAKLLS